MNRSTRVRSSFLMALRIVAACSLWALAPLTAHAHCDTLDGPVVADARAALDKGDVTAALKWVQKDDEAAIRLAFKEALVVRTKGPEAKDLADRYFFETLVRIHRAGEGAPFTGLKPAGTVDPGIAAADHALETGSSVPLEKLVTGAASSGLRARYAKVQDAAKRKDTTVEAGREYVEAYVQYVHYVEALLVTAGGAASHEVEAAHAHEDAQPSKPCPHTP